MFKSAQRFLMTDSRKKGDRMKKIISLLCFLLLFCTVFSTVCSAAGEDYDTLTNWNVRIAVPEGTTAALKGSEYYIYAQESDSIPYVMVRAYQYDGAENFLRDFTAYMQGQYSDLKVTADITEKTIGSKSGYEVDYSYRVSGYEVRDRRIAVSAGGTVYLFTSKEVEELDMTIGSMLDDVVAECEFLSDDDVTQNSGLAPGYLYCQEDGMPKYWLDFSGAVTDNLVLHCYFRSGGTAFSESCFVLDLSTAEVSGEGMKILQVRDLRGTVLSDRFKTLTLQFYRDAAVMKVEPGGKTPAGVAEDRIPKGTYVMVPVGVTADSVKKQSHLRPLKDGPYSQEELAAWAQFYAFRNTGVFPPETGITENPDGTLTIRLFEEGNAEDPKHAAIFESYTVDLYGEGKNDSTKKAVSLMK